MKELEAENLYLHEQLKLKDAEHYHLTTKYKQLDRVESMKFDLHNKSGLTMKRYRSESMMKQKDMAKKLDISQSLLSDIEHNRKFPTLALLDKFCTVIKINPSDFMDKLEREIK